MLSDILSYVFAKGAWQQAEQAADSPQHRVSQHESHQIIAQEAVFKSCFKMLHALAYKNDVVRIILHKNKTINNYTQLHLLSQQVQKRLFDRLSDLLKVRVAIHNLAEVLTEVSGIYIIIFST